MHTGCTSVHAAPHARSDNPVSRRPACEALSCSSQGSTGRKLPTQGRVSQRTLRREVASQQCSAQSQTRWLPNGLEVAFVSRADVRFLFEEVFEGRSYLQHGISLRPGDTVIDVGANIGFFSMLAASLTGDKGHVIAVEPIPPVYDALDFNIRSYARYCRGKGINPAPIEALDVGIASEAAEGLAFTFYERAAGWSSMQPDEAEVRHAMDVFLDRALEQNSPLLDPAGAALGRLLQLLLPRTAFEALLRRYVGWMLEKKQTVTCRGMTLSDIIRSKHVSRVDLLKVDVERAELDVLHGVATEHWPLIQQIVVEVHDIEDRQAQIKGLLQRKGFDHVVSQQSRELEGSTLFTLYCRRNARSEPLASFFACLSAFR